VEVEVVHIARAAKWRGAELGWKGAQGGTERIRELDAL
jgi:hypothetical protein